MHRFLLALTFVLVPLWAAAQMPRERADPGGPVDELFWAPHVIGTASVTNLPAGNLDFTIMHVFGTVENGVSDLFGLDGGANIRFGLDWGLTDWLSVGIGRSRFDKLYDARFKANVVRQTKDGRMPIDVAVKGDVGVMTLENGFDAADRLSYFASLMIARRVNERLSLQITPMFAHFNTVFIEPDGEGGALEEENDHVALGLAGRWVLSERVALLAEYVPVLSTRSDGTTDTFAVGFDLETGGHVFQLYFTTAQGLTEQHLIARNTDRFFDGGFRFGFTVHRVFSL